MLTYRVKSSEAQTFLQPVWWWAADRKCQGWAAVLLIKVTVGSEPVPVCVCVCVSVNSNNCNSLGHVYELYAPQQCQIKLEFMGFISARTLLSPWDYIVPSSTFVLLSLSHVNTGANSNKVTCSGPFPQHAGLSPSCDTALRGLPVRPTALSPTSSCPHGWTGDLAHSSDQLQSDAVTSPYHLCQIKTWASFPVLRCGTQVVAVRLLCLFCISPFDQCIYICVVLRVTTFTDTVWCLVHFES